MQRLASKTERRGIPQVFVNLGDDGGDVGANEVFDFAESKGVGDHVPQDLFSVFMKVVGPLFHHFKVHSDGGATAASPCEEKGTQRTAPSCEVKRAIET